MNFFKESFVKEQGCLLELTGEYDDCNTGLLAFVTKKGIYILEQETNFDNVTFLHKSNING